MRKHSNEMKSARARYYQECMRCQQYCCRWLMLIHGAMVDQFAIGTRFMRMFSCISPTSVHIIYVLPSELTYTGFAL